MSESREHKRRYNLRLEFIAEFHKWLGREPPMIFFWKWHKWKKECPVWEKFSKKEFKFYDLYDYYYYYQQNARSLLPLHQRKR